MQKYYNRYYNLYPARPHEETLPPILAFGEFMHQSLATDEEAPPYSSDLARYELLYYQAAFAPTRQDSFAAINQIDDPQTQSIGADTCLHLQEGIYVSTFRFNIVKIAQAIEKGEEVGQQEDGTYCFVFQQRPKSLTPNIFAISPATRDLLALCDGTRNLGTIVNEMEKSLGREHLEADISKMVQHLQHIKVLQA